MSLIITSSNDPKNSPQLQVDAPYQYRNNFGSGMSIPANSEIAVESVKINRQPTIDYEKGQVCNFWMGERLADNASFSESLSYIIPAVNTVDRSLAPDGFAEEFTEVIKTAYSVHPEIDTVNGVTMTPVADILGGFKGFRYNINQVGASATSVVPPSGSEKVLWGGVTYDGTTLTSVDGESYVQFQPEDALGGPMSLLDGVLKYNNFTSSSWTVGLSRPILNDAPAGDIGRQNLDLGVNEAGFAGLGPDEDQFFDFAVQSSGGLIKCYHSVPESDGAPHTEMREINYYQKADTALTKNNASNSSFATGSPLITSKVTAVEFRIENEILSIVDQNGSFIVAPLFVGTSASYKDQVPKPVGQTCWKMYPTVSLWATGDDLDIVTYKCRTSSTIKKNIVPNTWNIKCMIHEDMKTIDVPLSEGGAIDKDNDDDYTTSVPWKGAFNWVQDVDFRSPNIRLIDELGVESTLSGHDYVRPYQGISGSSLASYEPLLIVGKTDKYTNTLTSLWQPNMADQLGMKPFSIAPLINSVSTTGATGGHASFLSAHRPSMSSEHSTFIRVPTLNHKTFNFGTGNPSKILFQVPRFDNAGTDSGALFFQNADKTYIDLNNMTDTMITDLDVQFVRKDEKFAKDLTGSSEVVFSVRNKK
tara:strand:+ start:779 stop:2713 length:1935 start_codon:yes stop_codon:yes gene_type:complete